MKKILKKSKGVSEKCSKSNNFCRVCPLMNKCVSMWAKMLE